MYRVLAVEDSDYFQTLVKNSLGRDFDVVCAATAGEALDRLENGSFDVIILDIGLPDKSGFEFCAELSGDDRFREIPIVFLSGKNETQDKVLGFSLGAEDYVNKPFDPFEFRARIEARARHRNKSQGKLSVIRAGDIEIDTSYQRVTLQKPGAASQVVSLTMVEFRILYCLASRREMVLTRTQLLEEVWGRGLHVLERTVDKHICSLRSKLASSTHAIKTITGVGYRLTAEEN